MGVGELDMKFDVATGPYRRTPEAPSIAGALQVTGSSAGLAVVLWTLPDRTPFFLLYLLCQPQRYGYLSLLYLPLPSHVLDQFELNRDESTH